MEIIMTIKRSQSDTGIGTSVEIGTLLYMVPNTNSANVYMDPNFASFSDGQQSFILVTLGDNR